MVGDLGDQIGIVGVPAVVSGRLVLHPGDGAAVDLGGPRRGAWNSTVDVTGAQRLRCGGQVGQGDPAAETLRDRSPATAFVVGGAHMLQVTNDRIGTEV